MVKFLIREGSNKSLYNFGLRVVRNREEYEFHVSLIVSYIYIQDTLEHDPLVRKILCGVVIDRW